MLILLEENQRKIFSKYKYTISSFAIIVVIFLIFTPVMLAQAKSTFEGYQNEYIPQLPDSFLFIRKTL